MRHGRPPPQPVGGWHTPAEHADPGGQTVPQPPQLATSLRMSTHPFEQHVVPPWQPGKHPADWHTPAKHTCPGAHTVPQRPQLLLSTSVLTQRAPQQFVSPVHAGPPPHVVAGTQRLFSHMLPAGQSAEKMHRTHAPVARSHTGVAGVAAQSAFD